MKIRRLSLVLVFIGLLAKIHLWGAGGYENDFEKSQVGSTPDDFLILDGSFVVREAAGNKCLELPGAPLDSYGLLFGPTDSTGQTASVRILGSSKGRRSPTFGLGLNGVPGFKLQVSPAKKQVELLRGDAVVHSAPLIGFRQSGLGFGCSCVRLRMGHTSWKERYGWKASPSRRNGSSLFQSKTYLQQVGPPSSEVLMRGPRFSSMISRSRNLATSGFLRRSCHGRQTHSFVIRPKVLFLSWVPSKSPHVFRSVCPPWPSG